VIQAPRRLECDLELWLSEEQFERLRPFLPNKVQGVARVDDRRVISGIIYAVKSGSRRVDASACYGPRKTLYNRFVRWATKGVWQDLFRHACRPSFCRFARPVGRTLNLGS